MKCSQRKAACSGKILSISYFYSSISSTFSNIFDIDDSSAIGQYLSGLCGSLPGLGMAIMVALFHADGK